MAKTLRKANLMGKKEFCRVEVARSNGCNHRTCNGFVGKTATNRLLNLKTVERKEIQNLIDSQTEALN
jgi:hypothetical protein